ncbi:MAG: hypothetical protein V6Z89_15215 [Desulfobacter sp.]
MPQIQLELFESKRCFHCGRIIHHKAYNDNYCNWLCFDAHARKIKIALIDSYMPMSHAQGDQRK